MKLLNIIWDFGFPFAVLQVPGVHEAAAVHSRGHASSPQEDLPGALRLQTVWLFEHRQTHIDLKTRTRVRMRNTTRRNGLHSETHKSNVLIRQSWKFLIYEPVKTAGRLAGFSFRVRLPLRLTSAVQICLYLSVLDLEFNEGCDGFSENMWCWQTRKSSTVEKSFTGHHKDSRPHKRADIIIFFFTCFKISCIAIHPCIL